MRTINASSSAMQPASEQDDIVNSLNYEGIAVIELQFYHFPDSDRLRVGSVTG